MQTRLSMMLLLSLVVTLGCSNNKPAYKKPPAERVKPVPELNLNLPVDEEACLKPNPEDRSFIEKAFAALNEGDHIDALQYFKSYERTEQSEVKKWEARIGIAYLIFIPSSPVHDMQAASSLYRDVRDKEVADVEVHFETLIMRDAMEAFHSLEEQISSLRQRNRGLREDLDKREEALKRLRELTIGS